jgi:hypothetical protein
MVCPYGRLQVKNTSKINSSNPYTLSLQANQRNMNTSIPPQFASKPDSFERRLNDDRIYTDIDKVRDTFKKFVTTARTLQQQVNALDKKVEKKQGSKGIIKTIFTSLAWIIPIRRINTVPDKVENKDYVATASAIGVAGVMLPEDWRDMKDAWDQIVHHKLPIYDYKNCQTYFRWIRGTLAQPVVNRMKTIGYYAHKFDKSFAETGFGEKLRKLLKVEFGISEETGREVPKIIKDGTECFNIMEKITAQRLKGPFLGKIIYRAMQRTTVIGAVVLFVIGIPSIVKAFKKPEKTQDKLSNAGKQTVKVSISVASVLSGIGIFGALGASKFKYVGSVVGMGIGAVIGSFFANKINKNIKTEN